jgi:hypothetical protein
MAAGWASVGWSSGQGFQPFFLGATLFTAVLVKGHVDLLYFYI